MPKEMSDNEKERWRERSAHADFVWQEKGLTGNSTSEIGSILRLLDAYRGDQWKHIGVMNGVSWDNHLVINTMFTTANTLEAQLLAQLPSAQVFGKTPAAALKQKAWKALLDWAITEIKFDRAANAALRDAFFRFGVIRMGYTPPDEIFDNKNRQVEFGSPTTSNLPWLRRVAPWDIRIDPLAESWHADSDARWCEFISLYTLEQLKRMPGITVPRDLTATISKDKRQTDERRRVDHYTYEAANLVEVRTVYDAEERKWFQWSPGSDKLLRAPDDWPDVFRGLEGLPYAMLAFNEPADDACPIGYADMIWPLQSERNKVRTMLSELVRRHRRIITGNKSAFDELERQKITEGELAEIFWANGDVQLALREIPVAGFDQGLLLYDAAIQEDIRETIGQSKMARAQRINVETATEAARVGAGDDVQMGRNQIKVHTWLKDSIRMFAKGIQALPNSQFTIPVVGLRDAQLLMTGLPQVLQISTEQLQGEFDFDIAVGSNLPRSERQEIGKSMAWLQTATQFPQNVNIPAALTDLAVSMGKDPATSLMNAQQVSATEAALPNSSPVEQSPGGINPIPFLVIEGGKAA